MEALTPFLQTCLIHSHLPPPAAGVQNQVSAVNKTGSWGKLGRGGKYGVKLYDLYTSGGKIGDKHFLSDKGKTSSKEMPLSAPETLTGKKWENQQPFSPTFCYNSGCYLRSSKISMLYQAQTHQSVIHLPPLLHPVH